MSGGPVPLWTAAEAIAATGGRCDRTWSATGVSIDSRTLSPGDLFVALQGPTFDGHDFVAEALAEGAAAAVVQRIPDRLPAAAPLLMVGDTQAALEALGRAARARTGARIIGVTGSVGKTGVKEALRLVLSAPGADHRQRRQPQQPLGRAAQPRPAAARATPSASSRWA